MKKSVSALVEGGKASAAPPLGPALGPLGVNIGEVVAAINEATKDFQGMNVPVKVIVEDKKFEIKVGTPPVSALVKKIAGIEKGSKEPGKENAGDVSLRELKSIAESKSASLTSFNIEEALSQILGSCVAMGVTVNGVDPREIQQKLKNVPLEELLKEKKEENGGEGEQKQQG